MTHTMTVEIPPHIMTPIQKRGSVTPRKHYDVRRHREAIGTMILTIILLTPPSENESSTELRKKKDSQKKTLNMEIVLPLVLNCCRC